MQEAKSYPAPRMRNHVRRRLAHAFVWSCALMASEALAADPAQTPSAETTARAGDAAAEKGDPKKKAKEHFATGLKFYEDGDYSLALIEFERAYSYVPDFRVLYNIGQVSIQLARYARAAQALQQYLTTGGNKIPAARIVAVQGDLKMLENRTAHLMVKSNVDDAEVYLDDTLLGKTPMNDAILVDAGEHRISVQKAGFVSRSEPLVLAGRDESTLQLDLTPERPIRTTPDVPLVPVTTPPPYATPIAPPPAPAPRKNDMIYVGWGATGLLTVGWAVTGYIGVKAAGDLHNALQHTATESELQSLKNKARGWLLAADIIGAAAIVTGGTTLYFTLKHPARERPPPAKPQVSDLRIDFTGGGAQLSATF